ncbi:hybrid sensor histidine kinase/response regulator [Cupriavidus basilensis]|uniref:hybrid sensor histidine kinase/response regulator n=1 Tax=Cupriavidus basilensis TaxID=68895 RepID=UPI0020A6626E|nr:response regulator [Cupriavidus basilensis]MCP3022436.1 response regulator [Cupriavidus basilensis]
MNILPSPINARRPLILNVDDSDGARYVKGRILQRAGFSVLEAASGQAALSLVRQHAPDLVLLDVKLPDISGLEVCRLIKSDPETASTLVLQTSAALTESRHRVQALDGGADSYLIEPVDAEELVSSINALLRMRKAEEASRQSSRALRDNEELFRQLAENLSDALWILDPAESQFLFMSPSFAQLWGRPVEDLKHNPRNWLASVHAEDRERMEAAFDAMLRDGHMDAQFRLERGDGEVSEVRARAFPVSDTAGVFYRVAGICQDITPQKRAERMLLDEDRRKDDFLAMLAHELRNPLAPMRSAADLLMRCAPSREDTFKARDIIARQLHHLTRLVDDLLDISRFTQGRIVLRDDLVELRTALSTAVEAVRPLIDSRGHSLRLSVPEGPMPVRGDLVRLTQIFSNLLHNAARYTQPDGQLSLEVTSDGTLLTVRVRDNGPGLSPQALQAIFDPTTAHHGDKPRGTTGQEGMGIGLSLVQKLVKLHGGTVHARSAGAGLGCTFVVELPAQPWQSWQPEVGKLRSPLGTPRTVMVVDDNIDALEAMALTLEAMGHTVVTAIDGPAAIVRAVKALPDVILLDIGMPAMDGFEIAQRLRAIPELQHVRLVALTGYSQPADRQRTAEAGFDQHLVKPVDLEALSRMLDELGEPVAPRP